MHAAMLAGALLVLLQLTTTHAATAEGEASHHQPSPSAAAGSKPHIISVLQDDLGWYDTGIHDPAKAQWTKNITALAREGIVLSNHCKDTRPPTSDISQDFAGDSTTSP